MNPNYPYLHWLITLIVAPFMPALYGLIFNPFEGQILESHEIYVVIFIVSIFLSFPTFTIYYLVFLYLSKKKTNLVLKKLLLISCTVAGIIITLLIIGGSLIPTFILSYSVAAIITGMVLRIKNKEDMPQDFETNN